MAGVSSPSRQSPKQRQESRTGHTPVSFKPSDESPIPTPDWLTSATAPLGRFWGDVKSGVSQGKNLVQQSGVALKEGYRKVKDFMTE